MNFTIGPRNWIVKEVSSSWAKKNLDCTDELWGLCEEETATIYLVTPKKGWRDPMLREITLRHEIIHAMLFSLGYINHNEEMVDGLAHTWLQYENSVVIEDE